VQKYNAALTQTLLRFQQSFCSFGFGEALSHIIYSTLIAAVAEDHE
jgi:hypothetical protein